MTAPASGRIDAVFDTPAASPAGIPSNSPAGDPVGNPVGNPAGNPVGNPVGNPASNPAVGPARPAENPDAWYAMDALTGTLTTLKPMSVEDAEPYHRAANAAEAGAEVFRWTGRGRAPQSVDDARVEIVTALAARARGERMPYSQFDTASGTLIGSTSFYDVNPGARALAIGHTWLGRPWWRTGHNTESKLLMLAHAFDTLGAVRVVWHTDIFNERSQRAIERLGATKEAVLRKHRIRFDGTWRDTVQYSMTDDDWPEVRARLSERLGHG